MTVQYVSAHSSNINADRKSLLSQQLRSNLLNLRQFEKCFIVARWIRNLFEGAMSQPARTESNMPSGDPIHMESMMIGHSGEANSTREQQTEFSIERPALPVYNERQMAGMWSASDVLQNYTDILLTSWEQNWEDILLKN